MSRNRILAVAGAAILLFVAGLSVYLIVRGRDTTQALTYDSLMSRLSTAGATVTRGDPIEQPFLSVPGRFLKVNGTDVQVFEYATTNAANGDASRVAPDGCAVGTTIHIGWIAAPHFFMQGRVIVIYVGIDGEVLRLLALALGPQFAGATDTRLPPCP